MGLVTEMVAANTQPVMAKVTDIFASNVHIIWLKTMLLRPDKGQLFLTAHFPISF